MVTSSTSGDGLGTTVEVAIDVEDKHSDDATSPIRPRAAHFPDVPQDISSGYHVKTHLSSS